MREFVKAHELTNDFQRKLASFYVYPLTFMAKRSYTIDPEPGQDPDYDQMTSAIGHVQDSTKEKYPGPEIDSFLAGKTK